MPDVLSGFPLILTYQGTFLVHDAKCNKVNKKGVTTMITHNHCERISRSTWPNRLPGFVNSRQ